MLHNTRLERLANYKQSNLMVQFIVYEDKEVFLIPSKEPYSQHLPSLKLKVGYPNRLLPCPELLFKSTGELTFYNIYLRMVHVNKLM